MEYLYVLTWNFIRLNSHIQAKKLVYLTVELNHRIKQV